MCNYIEICRIFQLNQAIRKFNVFLQPYINVDYTLLLNLFFFYFREAAKNTLRGGGSLKIAAFGHKVLIPPRFAAKNTYPP